MMYYPGSELGNDFTNWWGPTTKCIKDILESTNFTVMRMNIFGERAYFYAKINQEIQFKERWKIEQSVVRDPQVFSIPFVRPNCLAE